MAAGAELLCGIQWFQGGLVFAAHRLCVSLNSRRESNKEEEKTKIHGGAPSWPCAPSSVLAPMLVSIRNERTFLSLLTWNTPQPSTLSHSRCRANIAHIRQSRPYSGLCFKVNVLRAFPLRSDSEAPPPAGLAPSRSCSETPRLRPPAEHRVKH